MSGLLSTVFVGPFRKVGVTADGGLGALGDAGDWRGGAAALALSINVLLLTCWAEEVLEEREWFPLPDVSRLLFPSCRRLEPQRSHRRIFSFYVSNIQPPGLCLTISSLGGEKAFRKGARHQRRLCSVEPQLQQRPLY